MPYNLQLANQIREHFEHFENVEEKAMMGGLTFMLDGKMCVGIIKDELMCRINPEQQNEALEKRGCRMMDFTTRPMKGYIMIDETGVQRKEDFEYFINLALEFNPLAKASKKKKKS